MDGELDIESLNKLGALAVAYPKTTALLALLFIGGLASGAVAAVLDPKKPRAARPEAAVNILAITGNFFRGLWPWVVQFWTGVRQAPEAPQERPTEPPTDVPPTESEIRSVGGNGRRA